MSQKIVLSKIDVVKRELEYAIKLFFYNGDFVIIHLIISACQDILEALDNSKKSLRLELLKSVKPEKKKYVREMLRKSYNYFKHADNDAERLLNFYPESNDYAIYNSIGIYQAVTGELTGLMTAFQLWFYIKNPEILLDDEKISFSTG